MDDTIKEMPKELIELRKQILLKKILANENNENIRPFISSVLGSSANPIVALNIPMAALGGMSILEYAQAKGLDVSIPSVEKMLLRLT